MSNSIILCGTRIWDKAANVKFKLEKNVKRENTIKKWQDRWNSSSHERSTYDLIHDIDLWLNRKHCELEFNITHIISGHACFKEYLHRFKIVGDPFCLCCPSGKETAKHVLLSCPRFDDIRYKLQTCYLFNSRQFHKKYFQFLP